jgi:hypothetical protein
MRFGADMIRKVLLATAAVMIVACGSVAPDAMAADGLVVRHSRIRHVCVGPKCGPFAPCGAHCRRICPGGYSCFSLYGAYGPYGGTGYLGAYTFSGWGRPW